MSFDYYWCLCTVTDEEFESLKPEFDYAKTVQKIPEQYLDAYQLCKKSPFAILPKFIPHNQLSVDEKQRYKNGYIENKLHNEFCCAFDIDEYRDIFQTLPLNENDVLRFLSNETPPIAVLYFALGLDNAEMLPDFFGNILVKKEEIDCQLEKIQKVLSTLNDQAWDRARRLISVCSAGRPSFDYDDEIREIFSALPDGLIEAKRRNKNFAAIATHQF